MKIKDSLSSSFRLYSKSDTSVESTMFDLINGDDETKQRKGLAYILSSDVNLIKRLVSIFSIVDFLEPLGPRIVNIYPFINFKIYYL